METSQDDVQRLYVRYFRVGVDAIVELSASLEATDDCVVLLRRVGRLVDLASLYELPKHVAIPSLHVRVDQRHAFGFNEATITTIFDV